MELIFQELFLSRYFFGYCTLFFVFTENISILFEWWDNNLVKTILCSLPEINLKQKSF